MKINVSLALRHSKNILDGHGFGLTNIIALIKKMSLKKFLRVTIGFTVSLNEVIYIKPRHNIFLNFYMLSLLSYLLNFYDDLCNFPTVVHYLFCSLLFKFMEINEAFGQSEK